MRQAYSSRLSIAMAAENAKPRTDVRGLQTYFVRSAVLLLATLLLATLTWLLLATLLLLTTLTRLRLTTLLLLATLLARFLVRILIHSFFLSNVGSPLRSLVFHGRSQSAANAFRSKLHIEAMCLELVSACRVPSCKRRTDDGTLFASVVAWGADSDSCADLALRWPSLDA
jgi:hypothetical protein